MNLIMKIFDWIFLCKISKTHPLPTDLQLLRYLENKGPITCLSCGKEYRYT